MSDRQDGEAERARQEQLRVRQIQRENREARRRAADPARRDQIDPSTGRTWRDAVARDMYGESRVQAYRDQCDRFRRDREEFGAARGRTR